jgi:uncharacterized phage-like protein YoqJ
MIMAFTGHRPERLGNRVNEVYSAIQGVLLTESPTIVISGMANGVDQLAAGWARAFRIPWIAAVPFPDQHKRWPAKHQEMYLKLIEDASRIEVISESYNPGVYQKRDEWMVDKCDMLVAVFDGVKKGGTWNTINYANKVGKVVKYLEWQ